MTTDQDDPTTVAEALERNNQRFWDEAMKEGFKALEENETQELTDLPFPCYLVIHSKYGLSRPNVELIDKAQDAARSEGVRNGPESSTPKSILQFYGIPRYGFFRLWL